jgi:hypothetical protein
VRCYFMRDGHIVGVEALPDMSDAEAIARGHQLLKERRSQPLAGFEIWDRARIVIQYPSADATVGSLETFGLHL